MKRLVNINEISHEEWLIYRKKGITGTDAGAIVGMNPYVSSMHVYQNKISDDTDQIDNEAMRQGRELEDYVAKRFMEHTGKKVRKAQAIFYNEEHPFMLGNFDRLVVGENAGLECKTVSPYSADKWKDGKIPLHYQIQCQHYLAVSGCECWYLAALVFGQNFIVHKIERDEDLINSLIKIEQRFWEDNVLAGILPDPDGSDTYTDAIARMYADSRAEKTIELFGAKQELDRRNEIDELVEKLEREKNEIDQKIKLQMQDAAYAEAEGYRISWVSSQSQRIDTKKLKEDDPNIYSKYSKISSSRRFMVKVA
ncbi:YqaJ viral recombinase family nuclease [[Clostridium] fimetarium]|uniref:Putative phage-type endonuclease n=1 Tax=[Clostridium] fimetarium TaxID=99656 RepID=A0A1I0Q038_9FIRM|nr:YqaJ viral recombinase family protein [[Clostridium] fimetarium]SEW20323.1 putative phage-type endonuclease [[Clostridium] fimetarium]